MRFPRRDGTCCHDRVDLRNGTKHRRGGVHVLQTPADLREAGYDIVWVIEQYQLL
jgi:hypothetical protein